MDGFQENAMSKSQASVQIRNITSTRKPKRFYKPIAHRTVSIITLVIIALVFIGLIEHAVRKLPHTSTTTKRPTRFQKRQTSYSTGDEAIDNAVYALTHDVDDETLDAAIDGLAQNGGGSAPTPSNDKSTTSTAFDVEEAQHLDPTIRTLSGYSDYPSDLIPSTTLPKDTPTAEPEKSPEPTTVPVAPSPIETSSVSFPTDTTPQVTSSAVIATSTPEYSAQQDTLYRDGYVTEEPSSTWSNPAQTITATYNRVPSYTSRIKVPGSATSHLSPTKDPPSDRYLDDQTQNPTSQNDASRPKNTKLLMESDKSLSFVKTPVNYFYGIYFPVLLAVFFRMLIGYFYTTTKMMEPFMMLSRAEGVKAKDFLWINYLSANDSLAPFQAMFSGHWLMLWTAVLYMFVQILSPLSAELFGIYPSLHKINDSDAVAGAAVWVHPQVARLMQGILAFTCIMLLSLWMLLRKNRSHLYSDPSSISGIASLVHHPDTVQDFERLDQFAPGRRCTHNLSHKTYRLGFYPAYDGSDRYGVISEQDFSIPYNENDHVGHQATNSKSFAVDQNKILLQISLNALLFLLTAGLLSLIAIYYTNHDPNNRLERFMSSQTFGPRFLLIIMGIIINSQWTRLERRSVVFEPFRRLQQRKDMNGVSAQETILASRSLIPMTTLATSLVRRNFLSTLLAFTALLSEVLIIVLPGIPFDAGQIWRAARISRYLCFSILGFMILVMWGYWGQKIWKWARNEEANLPKDPNTLGAMMMYVAGTRMADELGELGACSGREVEKEFRGRERGAALMKKGDRWIVDFEDGMTEI